MTGPTTELRWLTPGYEKTRQGANRCRVKKYTRRDLNPNPRFRRPHWGRGRFDLAFRSDSVPAFYAFPSFRLSFAQMQISRISGGSASSASAPAHPVRRGGPGPFSGRPKGGGRSSHVQATRRVLGPQHCGGAHCVLAAAPVRTGQSASHMLSRVDNPCPRGAGRRPRSEVPGLWAAFWRAGSSSMQDPRLRRPGRSGSAADRQDVSQARTRERHSPRERLGKYNLLLLAASMLPSPHCGSSPLLGWGLPTARACGAFSWRASGDAGAIRIAAGGDETEIERRTGAGRPRQVSEIFLDDGVGHRYSSIIYIRGVATLLFPRAAFGPRLHVPGRSRSDRPRMIPRYRCDQHTTPIVPPRQPDLC